MAKFYNFTFIYYAKKGTDDNLQTGDKQYYEKSFDDNVLSKQLDFRDSVFSLKTKSPLNTAVY